MGGFADQRQAEQVGGIQKVQQSERKWRRVAEHTLACKPFTEATIAEALKLRFSLCSAVWRVGCQLGIEKDVVVGTNNQLVLQMLNVPRLKPVRTTEIP